MNIDYISVTELNNLIQNIIESDIRTKNILLKGEISSLSRGTHYYFNLKDEDSSIRAVMFSRYVNALSYVPKDGDEVIVYGSVNIYKKSGTYQIIVEDMMLFGAGNKLIKIEELRKKLEAEGLFKSEHKLTIPAFPKTIGVITAKTGAAIHDITKNLIARYPLISIKYYDSAVQGKNALKELLEGLSKAIEDKVDVIILGRGGGDKDDLDAFNEEALCRAVYASPIPIISAVGHESDTTLVDYVSDVRAATPTEAAVKATPNMSDLLQNIDECNNKIKRITNEKLNQKKAFIHATIEIINAHSPINRIKEQKKSLLLLKDKMKSSLTYKLASIRLDLDHFNKMKDKTIGYMLNVRRQALSQIISHLELVNPMNTIERGYSLSYDSNGHIISKIEQVNVDEVMKTVLKDGTIISKVIRKGENHGED